MPEDEIKMFCEYKQEKAISIELIHHILGGPNMDYEVMNVADSFQCFEFCGSNLIKELKETKEEIMFFEHRKNASSNILAVVTRQPKSRGYQEHLVLKTVIRITVMMTPHVSFARSIDVRGTACFTVCEQIFPLIANNLMHYYSKYTYLDDWIG